MAEWEEDYQQQKVSIRWTNCPKQEEKKEQKASGKTEWVMRQLKDLNFSVLASVILNNNLITIN